MIWGTLCVILAGVISGSGAWPMKPMRHYQFEHWWFVGMLSGLVIFPWLVTVVYCPHLAFAIKSIPVASLLKANAWAAGWGAATVLCGLCYVRVGMALTTAILSGVGICLGVALPLAFKGSGVFQHAPSIFSPAGLILEAGALVALVGVGLAGLAGHGRVRARSQADVCSSGFLLPLFMAGLAGILSCGYTLSFIYGQEPIISAVQAQGASRVAAAFAVWALALAGGVLVGVGYTACLLTRNRSWQVLWNHPKDFCLSLVIGLNMAVSIALLGSGMLLMGASGGSAGSGLQQIAWMLGGQGVGYVSGEWQGVPKQPRYRMLMAVAALFGAAVLLAFGSSFAPS